MSAKQMLPRASICGGASQYLVLLDEAKPQYRSHERQFEKIVAFFILYFHNVIILLL
jgi:hypothetical protein